MPQLAVRPDLSAALLAVAEHQHGALTSAQLHEHGVGSSALRSLQRCGLLTEAHRGVHVLASMDAGLRTRAMAARLTTGAPAHACLETAATLDGWLDEWGPDPVRIAMDPRTKTRQAHKGIERHWHAVDPTDLRRIRALTLTGHSATVRDLALHRSMPRVVAILDSALHRRRIDPALLSEIAAALPGGRALWHPLLDARSESPLESETRVLMVLDGLAPEPQLEVVAGGHRYRLDLPFPQWRVTVECDGEGFHGLPAPLYVDRRRQADLAHAGWTVIRSTWLDRRQEPRALLDRIWRALHDNGCPYNH